MNTIVGRDGVAIGYDQVGHGPGLVILHGSMESGSSHRELAEALADDFTVYLPDRRGRGGSGPYGPAGAGESDVDDVRRLLERTGATNVFGVSSGAIIALLTALAVPSVRRLGVFEPPLFPEPSEPAAILDRFEAELDRGELTAALVTGMLGAKMGPSFLRALPRPVLRMLTRMGMAAEERGAKPGAVTMRALAPTLRYDFRLAVNHSGPLDAFKGIQADVLLLGASRSPAYLRAALDALARALPDAARTELAGLDHGATGNANRRGHPAVVARELREFFGRP